MSGGTADGVRTNLAVGVINGLFTTTLDFGGVPDGSLLWFQLAVRTNGSGDYTTLTPRQQVTPTPYALFANTASNLVGSLPAAQISGSVASANLSGTYSNMVQLNNAGNSFTGDGAGLTGVVAVSLATPPGMVLIPAGAFTMGNSINDPDITDASPTNVPVSAFYMDVNLVSYSQWQSVYFWATNHGFGFTLAGSGKAANHPVQTVDWYDAVKWCNARSERAGLTPVYYTNAGLPQAFTIGETTNVYANWTASGYRLPTEAEWEKAARGGLSGQRFPWGNVTTENLANYYGATASYSYDLGPNGDNQAFANGVLPWTSPVGSFVANDYGLYDMAGNVEEWCWDWYGPSYTGGSDPRGPSSGSLRVLRGGIWDFTAYYSRCACRDRNDPDYANYYVGFRCVRGL